MLVHIRQRAQSHTTVHSDQLKHMAESLVPVHTHYHDANAQCRLNRIF